VKITINVAMTLDGKIDTVARQGASISSDLDWERVDRLRAAQDAILVGGRTLLDDDPRLTVKSATLREERITRGFAPDPVKVGIVSNATLLVNSRFLTAGAGKIIIFTTQRTSSVQLSMLRDAGVQAFVIGEKRVDLVAAMDILNAQGIERVLVEGGGTLNAALLAEGLVDEVQVYIAPLIFGGATAPTIADDEEISRSVRLDLIKLERLDDGGIWVRYLVL